MGREWPPRLEFALVCMQQSPWKWALYPDKWFCTDARNKTTDAAENTRPFVIKNNRKNRLSDYYWIMVDMLNSCHSHLSKYSTFVLEECQRDEIVSDKQDRLFRYEVAGH